MKINVTNWSYLKIVEYMRPFRGKVSANDAVTMLEYWPIPKVA